MERYLKERSLLFNEASEFSCPDVCDRHGCREPDLHITISLVDLVGVSMVSGRKPSDLFMHVCKIGFDPLDESDPWVGRIAIELRKPCPFLEGKKCGVYPGRPVACALFPEAFFILTDGPAALEREIFRKFPCVKSPVSISPRRKEILLNLLRMSAEESFLSDFYLFGVSPFLLDLKNIAGEGLEGVEVSRGERVKLPYPEIEGLITGRLHENNLWSAWEEKVGHLDQNESVHRLWAMKTWTDQMVGSPDLKSFVRAYQFSKHRLQVVRFW
jgi:hypothetical protein